MAGLLYRCSHVLSRAPNETKMPLRDFARMAGLLYRCSHVLSRAPNETKMPLRRYKRFSNSRLRTHAWWDMCVFQFNQEPPFGQRAPCTMFALREAWEVPIASPGGPPQVPVASPGGPAFPPSPFGCPIIILNPKRWRAPEMNSFVLKRHPIAAPESI